MNKTGISKPLFFEKNSTIVEFTEKIKNYILKGERI